MKKQKNDSSFLITVSFIFIGMLSVGLEASDSESAGADPAADMVLIPAGEFQMGDGSAAALVDLPAYFIDVYEVTNREYEEFTPCRWLPNGIAMVESGLVVHPKQRYRPPAWFGTQPL